jgi:hypothetical protein
MRERERSGLSPQGHCQYHSNSSPHCLDPYTTSPQRHTAMLQVVLEPLRLLSDHHHSPFHVVGGGGGEGGFVLIDIQRRKRKRELLFIDKRRKSLRNDS